MRISLIIPTYERPDALEAVLRSVMSQTVMPHQVIVGDDGSGPETKRVVDAAAGQGLPVTHVWLPHDGFRAGRMRNRASASAIGDYLIFSDDDILLHPRFIADHAVAADKGYFVQGTRALLDEAASRAAMNRKMYWPGFFAPGVSNRKNLIHSPILAWLFSGPVAGMRGIRTCNFALWREDLVRVNGFNEDFVGWGREDSEFVSRLLNAGVKRKNLRFAALGCHMHHPPRSREGLVANDAMLAASVEAGAVRCERGLNLHDSCETGENHP